MSRRLPVKVIAAVIICTGWLASTAAAAPVWSLSSTSNTTAAPGGTLDYLVAAQNVGDAPTDFTTYTLTVTLPSGVTGVRFRGGGSFTSCPGIDGASVITCTGNAFVRPYSSAFVVINVSVDPSVAAGGTRTASFEIEGGGALDSATTVDPVTISPAAPGFGVDAFDATAFDVVGEPLTQAGGHPSALTTSIDFNTFTDPNPVVGRLRPVEAVKDIALDLPPGFVGNPTAASRCTIPDLTHVEADDSQTPLCASTSQIGTVMLRVSGNPDPGQANPPSIFGPFPVYNMVPPSDAPARFGFTAARVLVLIDAKAHAGNGYGITAHVTNASQGIAIVGTTLRLWGVPSDSSHDNERACAGQAPPAQGGGPTCASGAPRKAFFRNPTSCTALSVGLVSTMHIDSWEHPGIFKEATFTSHLLPGYPAPPQVWGAPVGTEGCHRVPFDPTFIAQPLAGTKAGAPASMAFDV